MSEQLSSQTRADLPGLLGSTLQQNCVKPNEKLVPPSVEAAAGQQPNGNHQDTSTASSGRREHPTENRADKRAVEPPEDTDCADRGSTANADVPSLLQQEESLEPKASIETGVQTAKQESELVNSRASSFCVRFSSAPTQVKDFGKEVKQLQAEASFQSARSLAPEDSEEHLFELLAEASAQRLHTLGECDHAPDTESEDGGGLPEPEHKFLDYHNLQDSPLRRAAHPLGAEPATEPAHMSDDTLVIVPEYDGTLSGSDKDAAEVNMPGVVSEAPIVGQLSPNLADCIPIMDPGSPRGGEEPSSSHSPRGGEEPSSSRSPEGGEQAPNRTRRRSQLELKVEKSLAEKTKFKDVGKAVLDVLNASKGEDGREKAKRFLQRDAEERESQPKKSKAEEELERQAAGKLKERKMWSTIVSAVKGATTVQKLQTGSTDALIEVSKANAVANNKYSVHQVLGEDPSGRSEKEMREENEEEQLIARRQKSISIDAVTDASDYIITPDFYIDPRSPARQAWDVLVIFLVVYNVVAIPYYTCFDPATNLALTVSDYSIDSIFLIDLASNFVTGYYDEWGRIVAERHRIRAQYLVFWFWIDFFASFPLELFLLMVTGGKELFDAQVFSILKFPRLLRLGRIFKYLEKIKNADMLRILRLVFFVVLINHWSACAFYAACDPDANEEYWCHGKYKNRAYLDSYYLSLMALMGDSVPVQGTLQTTLATVLSLSGSFMLAIIFGSVATLVNHLTAKEVQYQHQMDYRNELMRYLRMPFNTQERVRQFYEYMWLRFRDHQNGMDKFANPLPPSLKEEVLFCVHQGLLMRVPFFAKLPNDVIKEIVKHITTVVAIPGEVIIRKGMRSRGLYLLSRGECEVLGRSYKEYVSSLADMPASPPRTPDTGPTSRSKRKSSFSDTQKRKANQDEFEKKYAPVRLKGGDYFGELSLITRGVASRTIMAISFCDLNMLPANEFDYIISEYPALAVAVVMERRIETEDDQAKEERNRRKSMRKSMRKSRVQNAASSGGKKGRESRMSAWAGSERPNRSVFGNMANALTRLGSRTLSPRDTAELTGEEEEEEDEEESSEDELDKPKEASEADKLLVRRAIANARSNQVTRQMRATRDPFGGSAWESKPAMEAPGPSPAPVMHSSIAEEGDSAKQSPNMPEHEVTKRMSEQDAKVSELSAKMDGVIAQQSALIAAISQHLRVPIRDPLNPRTTPSRGGSRGGSEHNLASASFSALEEKLVV